MYRSAGSALTCSGWTSSVMPQISAEATRGSITGQMKALAMIAAIEGLIPSATKNDRRHAPSATQPAATPPNTQIDDSGWRPKAEPAVAEPVASRVPEPPLAHNAGQLNPFVIPQPVKQAPASLFDVALDAINSANLPYSARPNGFAHSR